MDLAVDNYNQTVEWGGKPDPSARRGGRGPRAVRTVCFAQNTRDELRIVRGSVCGALAAEPGMKQQNYLLQKES